MTKQPVDEAALKCHLPLEGAGKVGENVTNVMSNNALVICDVDVVPERTVPLKTAPIKTHVKEADKLGKVMCELYNLESGVESDKPVKINLDLDLYQMEKV